MGLKQLLGINKESMVQRNLENLDRMFFPRSVAFVGATESPNKWGNLIFENMLAGGYEGQIYPVNPGRESVFGYKAYPSVRDIPGEVDLAVLAVPTAGMEAAVEDCAAEGVKAAVAISAGFKELGGDNAQREMELVRRARAGGMLLAGPNGQGICCPKNKLFPWMPPYFPPDGRVAVISQSGNIQGLLVSEVVNYGFGVSKGVSSGNEADLKTEDYFRYLADDPDTEVILSYMEGVNGEHTFLDSARQASLRKPLVILKGGRTGSGVAAARSHTGAMAVSERIFESACRQLGIACAHTISEAGILASSFLNRPLPRGRRVGILTGGGGLGVLAADGCSEAGLQVATLSQKTLEAIGKHMPPWWVAGNPVDLVAGLNYEAVLHAIEILLTCGEIDALMVLFIMQQQDLDPSPIYVNESRERVRERRNHMFKMMGALPRLLFDAMHRFGVPIYSVSNLRRRPPRQGETAKMDKRMTVFRTIEDACATIRAMADRHAFLQNAGLGSVTK